MKGMLAFSVMVDKTVPVKSAAFMRPIPGWKLMMGIKFCRATLLLSGILLTLAAGGCGRPGVRPDVAPPAPPVPVLEKKGLFRLGHTIQAGAFAHVENAARLTRSLQEKGINATYFVARRGLYRVRFGNFPSREQARIQAEELRDRGIIEEFHLVGPEEYAVAQMDARGEAYLREELARTALSFLGVPYLWGGTSAETGFDCSGLTMTVYHLNGFDLPRRSRDQFAAGNPVDRSALGKGDILFFADNRDRISHVGLYVGNDLFIHAPGRGKRIRTDFLTQDYYRRAFVGARSYL